MDRLEDCPVLSEPQHKVITREKKRKVRFSVSEITAIKLIFL